MSQYTDRAHTGSSPEAGRFTRLWTTSIPYLTAAWSLVYGCLAVFWTLGGRGFPFGHANDPQAALSVFAQARVATMAPVLAAFALGGVIVATWMIQGQRRPWLRIPLLGFAWTAAVVLALIIPDYRVLMAVAYAPVFLVGAPFDWPPVSYLEAVPWPVLHQGLCTVGGLLWGATAVWYQRQQRGACVSCGRTASPTGWTTPTRAARWGRWAVAVAVIIPVLYALTRYAWVLGMPLGITEAFLREGQASGLWRAGAGLSTVAVGGAILTLGLVQRWGEIFPRWMLGLAGRSVPIWLALVPATVVSVIVTSAGFMYVRNFMHEGFPPEGWATTGPELLWPVWGAALGAGTLAYYYRRRGPCHRCGRGVAAAGSRADARNGDIDPPAWLAARSQRQRQC